MKLNENVYAVMQYLWRKISLENECVIGRIYQISIWFVENRLNVNCFGPVERFSFENSQSVMLNSLAIDSVVGTWFNRK